jgi:hypothetical protein
VVDRFYDEVTLWDGTKLRVHPLSRCVVVPLQPCVIHRPSDHPLKDAPLAYHAGLNAMFRICEHSEAHPDPDSLRFLVERGVPYGSYPLHDCCSNVCCGNASWDRSGRTGDGVANQLGELF